MAALWQPGVGGAVPGSIGLWLGLIRHKPPILPLEFLLLSLDKVIKCGSHIALLLISLRIHIRHEPLLLDTAERLPRSAAWKTRHICDGVSSIFAGVAEHLFTCACSARGLARSQFGGTDGFFLDYTGSSVLY